MTFTVSLDAKEIQVAAKWGRYRREESKVLYSEVKHLPRIIWKRTPVEPAPRKFPLKEGNITTWVPYPDQPDVFVQGFMRRRNHEWLVTLFLVNGQQEPAKLRDEAWIFQPELIVESPDGQAIFEKSSLKRDASRMDPVAYAEEQAMAMIYRRQVEFAVGHGVSVHAETADGDTEHAIRIRTCTIPAYEVPKQTPPTVEDNPDLEGLVLDMDDLAKATDVEFTAKLGVLADAYEKWIERQEKRVDDPVERLADYRIPAKGALENCRKALKRIREGIELLSSNPQAADAFRFANRAMHLQRVHSEFAERKRRGEKPKLEDIDIPKNRSWYPFQLAFILINLPSITDLHHKDRSDPTQALADLLWFPTGGGKTEAYLGLTAYTMALRRLQGRIEDRDGEHGVAVLMRYTLRLLTLQQFQRASALVCACEMIRRDDEEKWGKTRFRIGLWVGKRTTPNKTEESFEAVRQEHGHYSKSTFAAGSGSPHQLTNCPWCGRQIDPGKHIRVDKDVSRTIIYCGDNLGNCPFSERKSPGEGLPIMVVDEEIYRHLPTLIIATVDKFAQLPWNGRTQMLFGQVNGYCERHGFRSPEIEDTDSHPKRLHLPSAKTTHEWEPLRPPDLIVQDELHLISGPLGTLVGLYETVVDELCSWTVDGKKVRPKVIASTATIRRAATQVNALFLRDISIFPPSGLDVQDNFFSLQRKPSEEFSGRRYIGICAPGKRLKASLIRVYLAFMSASQKLYEQYGTAADPWMTLVGYFNSLRELGGMRRLVDDDVRTRLRDMEDRGLAKRRPPLVEELTSRKGSTDIPAVLDQLEMVFDPVDEANRKALRKAGKPIDKPEPLDVLLATNMVSVGVDVKRLGLMVVAGQPKTTAEYIQATSRIGRSKPGIVCTIYNWARPRDLSHYEVFEHYHATFYQHVEALSVTPFAARALDRGLAALLVSAIRLVEETYNDNSRAQILDRNHDIVKKAVTMIAQRAELVAGSKKLGDEVRAILNRKLDLWLAEAGRTTTGRTLGYRDKKDGVTVGLLRHAGLGSWEDFTCLNSLRDVEPSVRLILAGEIGDEDTLPHAAPADGGAS